MGHVVWENDEALDDLSANSWDLVSIPYQNRMGILQPEQDEARRAGVDGGVST